MIRPRRTARPRAARRGLSLLEVLLALSIFLFALVALGELVNRGGNQALDSEWRNTATHYCQSKLAEVNAGAIPLSSQAETPIEEDPDWLWSLDAQEGTAPNLWQVTVRVYRERSDGTKIEVALTQWVFAPTATGTAAPASTGATTGTTGGTTP